MKDQIKSLTQSEAPSTSPTPVATTPSTSVSSSMHDDQGHDARLGF